MQSREKNAWDSLNFLKNPCEKSVDFNTSFIRGIDYLHPDRSIKYPNKSEMNRDLNQSKLVDTSQDFNKILPEWESICYQPNNFELHNISICDDLNSSISLMKSKLFNLTNDDSSDGIPRKKKNTYIQDNLPSVHDESFYGLPVMVKELIKKHKGIEKLYDWQDECLKMNSINDRRNLIYALPTSGGKTLVAEILMLREIHCKKKNAMFVLPFVALVQEKIQSITPFALEMNFLVEEYAAEKGHYPPRKRRKKNSLYVCTIEKAQTIINCLIELDRLNEIGIIVIDELHLLGESGGRGATLECLLTKVMYVNSSIQIVGMSATIGNLREVSSFLNGDLYVQNFRPVSLKEYVKCEKEIWQFDSREEEMFIDKKVLNYKYSASALQKDPDMLGGLVMDVVPKHSTLIFCSSKKNCENVAKLLTDVLFKSLQTHKLNEKQLLLKALESDSGRLCPILEKTIKFGVAYHHSGLTAEERKLLEEAFRGGVLCVICCTSTLAAGVNLPARRVIIRSPYVGSQFLSLSRYKQMIGRAGRAGMGDFGESILICTKNDIERVRELLNSRMDDAASSLHYEKDRGINNLIISCVLLNVAKTRSDIHKVMSRTLLKIQESHLGINVKEITDKSLSTLVKSGFFRVKQKDSAEHSPDLEVSVIFPSQNNTSLQLETSPKNNRMKKRVVLVNSSELELCPLGRAAMKGAMDLQCAHMLYEDLKKAQSHLMLIDCLHLMYLITPYDIADQVKPVGPVYYDVIMSLPPNQMSVARLIGINEAVVDKLQRGIAPKNVPLRTLQRFYVTLMLHELWNQSSIFSVAEKYQVNRGNIQNLLSQAASFSSSVARFCQELEEFWAFKDLFTIFGQKITYCCAAELEPLMELPHVKVGRAKQLYKAGYKTLQSIAKSRPEEIMEKIEHLPRRVATQITSAAKLLLLEKVENLRDEVEEVLDGLDI